MLACLLYLFQHYCYICIYVTRIINFYKATLNIPFLEVVYIRDDTTKPEELRLEIMPVGISNSVSTIDDLCIAM